jgi:competence protein ComEA
VAFSGTRGTSPPSGPPAQAVLPLDLNSATASELDGLPGIGPSRAAAILQYREQHGRFATVDELKQVRGFGQAAISRLQALLTVR